MKVETLMIVLAAITVLLIGISIGFSIAIKIEGEDDESYWDR